MFKVEDAISTNKLQACKNKYTNYIEEITKLLQTDLPMKIIITLEALIILEVHGKYQFPININSKDTIDVPYSIIQAVILSNI